MKLSGICSMQHIQDRLSRALSLAVRAATVRLMIRPASTSLAVHRALCLRCRTFLCLMQAGSQLMVSLAGVSSSRIVCSRAPAEQISSWNWPRVWQRLRGSLSTQTLSAASVTSQQGTLIATARNAVTLERQLLHK